MKRFIRFSIILMAVSMLLFLPAGQVFADSGLTLTKSASTDNATSGDTISYTYTITNGTSDNVTGLILTDDKLGTIPLVSDNVTVSSLAPGESITVTADYTVTEWFGSIENTATATGYDPVGNVITASSEKVTVTVNVIKSLLTKAGILKARGVPGKGIDTAPGLQKPFNPNSQADENAGKKQGYAVQEQNHNQAMNGNTVQNQEQEQEQNEEQEKNKNKEKNKGKGRGSNK